MYVKRIPRELAVTTTEDPCNLVDGFLYMDINEKVGCRYKHSMAENEQESEHGKVRG